MIFHMFLSAMVCGVLVLATCGISESAVTPVNGVFEASLMSTSEYANPSAEVSLTVHVTSPSGTTKRIDAFWDGGRVWRFRFSPTEAGKWRWRTVCSDTRNRGLHGRTGSFDSARSVTDNTLLQHGPLKLSSNRRYLVHSDGHPFFWLADTAWNGVLKASPEDWDKYLSIRRSQGFTAIQFVSTPWRSFDCDSEGETAFTGTNAIHINPGFFRRLDAKVAAINDHGMVASPVILWAVGPTDQGQALSENDAIRLSRYIVARWGAYNVVWILAGDGNYGGDRAERWRRIGRAVFGDRPERPVTMHPGGQQWVGEEFRREPWYSFIGYQSGHGDSDRAIRWLVEGPPATEWRKSPVLPVINLEPNYETIIAYDSKKPFDAVAVRRALYRSLLISPTAGVTYGHHGIWFWTDRPEVPKAHPGSGIALPWNQAVESEGARSVKFLSQLMSAIRWWTLRPDPDIITNPPTEPRRSVASARSDDGSLAVIYIPEAFEVELNLRGLQRPAEARWFNPSTGHYTRAGLMRGDTARLRPPAHGDWVLLVLSATDKGRP